MKDESAGENGNADEGILELIDPEDGSRHRFEVLELVVVDDREYVICAPLEGDEDDAYAFRLIIDGDEEYLEDIFDEDEWNAVAAAWENAEEEF